MAAIIKHLSRIFPLFVVSATTSDIIRDFLQREGLLDDFQEILGNDVDYSKARKIRAVQQKYGVAGENCLFITDTLGDILEAAACGVKSIAVTWGYHPLATLQKGNPAQIANEPQDLLRAGNLFSEISQ